jgi:hypothetical protein
LYCTIHRPEVDNEFEALVSTKPAKDPHQINLRLPKDSPLVGYLRQHDGFYNTTDLVISAVEHYRTCADAQFRNVNRAQFDSALKRIEDILEKSHKPRVMTLPTTVPELVQQLEDLTVCLSRAATIPDISLRQFKAEELLDGIANYLNFSLSSYEQLRGDAVVLQRYP